MGAGGGLRHIPLQVLSHGSCEGQLDPPDTFDDLQHTRELGITHVNHNIKHVNPAKKHTPNKLRPIANDLAVAISLLLIIKKKKALMFV